MMDNDNQSNAHMPPPLELMFDDIDDSKSTSNDHMTSTTTTNPQYMPSTYNSFNFEIMEHDIDFTSLKFMKTLENNINGLVIIEQQKKMMKNN